MSKKIRSFLLCILILTALPMTAYAQEQPVSPAQRNLPISTVEHFLAFAENCRLDSYSKDLYVTLLADIDLTGISFEGIPVFCGSFNGNGHTISGLDITCEGSHLGLFRYISSGAAVFGLRVEGNIHPLGSQQAVGGIAGSNAGTIENCSFRGSISGGDHVGGIAGKNSVTGVISDCDMEGSAYGNHFTGGIAGSNSGVIRGCSNSARINTTPQQNTVEISDITLESMMGSEAVNTVTDIGGIAGSSGGVIRSCENRGDVGYLSMGYNVGGIAGSQMGYITDCFNYGNIRGRKEVGGIAGQMEPVTNIEYTEDTLQILQGQLSSMASLANRASSHAQSGASDVSWHIAGVQDSILEAQDAVNTMLEDGFDPDSIFAAESVLNSSLHSIESNVSGAASALYDTVGDLSADMRAISNQISAMQETINNAAENLGGTITDISDADTVEDIVGKVSHCENHGTVTADANAGGIAGAMTLENDLDLDEDLQFIGEESLNYDSELRAVIRDCTNNAAVAVRKQNAGGIVGWMPMGLVKDCVNTGLVDAAAADYAGGIAGQSTGFIRDCHAKCEITGERFVGGIAGSADTVTNCRSMVLLSASERQGAVIGYTEISKPRETENTTEKETEEAELPPVFANFYTPIAEDTGAVDGISYHQLAQPLPMDSFLALEGLPEQLTYFTVRFVFASGAEKTVRVAPGETLQEADIPNLAVVDGRNSHWEGITDAPITFDCTFKAVYDPLTMVLQSEAVGADGKPLLLAEGAFLPDVHVMISDSDTSPVLEKGQTLLDTVSITLPDSEQDILLHYLVPEGADAERLTLYTVTDGILEPVALHVDGSYIVFAAQSGQTEFALVTKASVISPIVLAVSAALVLVLLLLRRRAPKAKA